MVDINTALNELRNIEGVTSSALISRDGEMIASNISEDVHSETLAVMTATMLGAAETISTECNRGGLDKVIVDSGDINIVVVGVKPEAWLVAITNHRTNFEQLLLEMRRISREISGEI